MTNDSKMFVYLTPEEFNDLHLMVFAIEVLRSCDVTEDDIRTWLSAFPGEYDERRHRLGEVVDVRVYKGRPPYKEMLTNEWIFPDGKS